MRSSLKVLVSCALGVVASLIGSPPPRAHACIGAVASVSENWRILGRAESAIDHGDYVGARRFAALVLNDRNADRDEGERAQWVTAMSFARDEDAADADLVAAVQTMRDIGSHRTLTDVVSKVDLGEALARREPTKAEARALLQPLAKADLIGSPHAYAALARIATDEKTRRTAIGRCQTMAHDSSLCDRGFVMSEAHGSVVMRPFAVGFGVVLGVVVLAAVAFLLRRRQRRSAEMTSILAECT